MQRIGLVIGICLILLSASIYFLSPRPDTKMKTYDFSGSAMAFRGLSGPFHTLMADRIWLLSSHISEVGIGSSLKVRTENFYRAMATVITLDPGFSMALKYGTTYLASIHKDVDLAHQLCDISLSFDQTNIVPYALKISNEMGYRKMVNYDGLAEWVKQATVNVRHVPDWFNGLLVYARKNDHRLEVAVADLEWMLKRVRTEEQRILITDRLKELQKQLKTAP